MILMVPKDDGIRYPSLGDQVIDWMQANLVFGPGDLRGLPLVLDGEQCAFVRLFYELFPRHHPLAGRRRFRRCALSLPKGLRKTELAAFVAAAELHPTAPVRFTGWRGKGETLAPGRGVTDPFVILMAYTEVQSDELCYGALKAILEESPIAGDFDIGLERIMRIGGDGKAVSLAGSPNANDGARTTFQVFDESHRMTLPRLKSAHQTMMANLPKRKIADPWALEITTAPEPGGGSIAEGTMEYAQSIADGRIKDPTLLFFHRQASDHHDLTTEAGARAAVIEASGPEAVKWRDIDAIVNLWKDPTTDRAYWERVWTNRLVQAGTQAFDAVRWKLLARPESPVKPGDLITIGFDGGQFHDSTFAIATHVVTGYQWRAGGWECPPGKTNWQVPVSEVDAVIRELFSKYTVWRMYADPPYWQSWLAVWQGLFGEERVIEWWTNRYSKMARAVEGFHTAITDGSITHDGDKDVARHIGNSRKQDIGQRDEQGKPMWVIRKDRPDSPQKIDAGVASVLSWEARTDAIAAGITQEPEYSIVVVGGRR